MDETGVGILGPGAVGHMLAFFLNQVHGLQVQMRGRSGLLSAGQPIVFQNGPEAALRLSTEGPPPRLWFACLKAHALVDGLRAWMQDQAAGTQIIILSNGYIEPLLIPLRRESPNILFRKGLVTRGIKRDASGAYVIGPKGQVIWGEERSPTALEDLILRELGPHGFQWNTQACRLRREKWYFNTCLNTLSGVHRYARNGLAAEEGRDELEALSHEVLLLARELWPDWQPAHRDLWQNLLRLIANTADNENSMAADVRLGRPTEAAVLSGMVHQAHDPSAYPILLALDHKLKSQG
ncbi:MAG TPA: ketopantoate reductase C-terminal domain-containing protein [Oligoflexus sp.]|uniref:ketopantoate reductase family protein n=1 Tax=Oligoflexus sp. TaxID=1971216 RepID=UPI002D7F3ADC|nr:ketopantoate reductase C-terminal domain-containing protein [Oligoflexus sp.]HET9238920.1 ketopantoate reductase C-terminal domain-containing protein [Oligoflexus sp.]